MNYQKIYDQIIERAKSEKRKKSDTTYYEKHHILPRCLGGSDKKDNLVLLTAREHFLAHWLLYEQNKGNRHLALAFFMMCGVKDKNQLRYIPSSRVIEYAKIQHATYHHSKLKKYKDIYSKSKKGKSLEEQIGKERALVCSAKKSETLKDHYKKHPELLKQKSESMRGKNVGPQQRFTCPKCGKVGGVSTMKQKHLPLCLSKATDS